MPLKGVRTALVVSQQYSLEPERELVTEVGENWGTKVGLDGVACSKEFFLNNPQGREWATTATGERARTIMKAYRDRGLLTAERRLKWNKLRCLAPNDTL